MTVTWGQWGGFQPLYWRVSGTAGGEVEVKISPVSGALLELIVIELPPEGGNFTEVTLREPGVPVFDRGEWGVLENPDYSSFSSKVIHSVEPLAMVEVDGEKRVIFSSKKSASAVFCGAAQVHLSEDGFLVAVVVK